MSKLKTFSSGTTSWKSPLSFKPLRTELLKLIETFESAMEEMENVKESIDQITVDMKAGDRDEKKTWNSHSTKISNFFTTNGVALPESVGTVCGHLLYATAVAPDTKGVTLGYRSPQFSVGDAVSREQCFSFPAVFDLPIDGEDQETANERSYWHAQLGSSFGGRREAVLAKQKSHTASIRASNLHKTFGSLETQKFEWNPSDGPDALKSFFKVPELKMTAFTQQVLYCSGEIPAFPCRQAAHFSTLFSGRAVVIMLDPDQIENHPDISNWLLAGDHKLLAKNSPPCCHQVSRSGAPWVTCRSSSGPPATWTSARSCLHWPRGALWRGAAGRHSMRLSYMAWNCAATRIST